MLATAKATLAEAAHQICLSDLYRDRFCPVPGADQFPSRAFPDRFELMREQAHANAAGVLPPDLRREQDRIQWADVLLFQSPLWWWSFPAILKGWVDRVLSNGFAYGERNLAGKSAMLAITAETRASRFEPGAANPILDPIETGILRYCGLDVLPAFVAPELQSIGDAARRRHLEDYAGHLRTHLR